MKLLFKKSLIAALCLWATTLFCQSSDNSAEIFKQKALNTLGQWKAAQNNGSFSAYAQLYSENFIGIKRVGKRVYQYAYRGWLRDRKRMFRKPFTVKVLEPQVSFGREKVVVLFKQIWASRTYRDEGMKEIVFSTSQNNFKIISEKMLNSEIKNRAGASAYKNIPVIMNQFLVLSNSIEKSWQINKIRLFKGVNYHTVISPPQFVRLPKSVQKLNGKTVTLMGPKGKLCTSKIKGIQIIASVTPHFGTIQNWQSDKSSPEKIAKDIWKLAKGRGKKLVAVVDECKGAIWATLNPGNYRIFETEKGLKRKNRAFQLFKALPGIARVQKDYTSYGEKGFWLKKEEVSTLLFSRGNERFYYMGVVSGEGCGQFYGEFWAIWKIDGDRWTLISNAKQIRSFFKPKTLYKAQNGNYFFADDTKTFEWTQKNFYEKADVSRPNLDCGC